MYPNKIVLKPITVKTKWASQKTLYALLQDLSFDEICKFHVRMNFALTFPVRETSAMIHSVRITVSHFQTHAFENLAIPYLHVRPSVLFKQSTKSKESKGERESERERGREA